MTWPTQGSNPDPNQQQPPPYGQQPQYPAQPYDQPYGAPQPTSGQPASGQPYSPGPAYPASPGHTEYQQPYQQPYAQPGYPATPGTNTMAILALVFAFVFSPLGIVFGHMARKQIKQTGEQGDGLALAGIIVGYVSVAIGLVVCCVYVIFAASLFGGAASTN